jgi:hypothetical protein
LSQHLLFFFTLRVGNDDHGAEPKRIGNKRKPDPGIPRGSLDNEPARLQLSLRDGILDDRQAGSIFDRAARIEELGFAENRAGGHLRGAAQLDQRGVADRADHVLRKTRCGPRGRVGKCGMHHASLTRAIAGPSAIRWRRAMIEECARS